MQNHEVRLPASASSQEGGEDQRTRSRGARWGGRGRARLVTSHCATIETAAFGKKNALAGPGSLHMHACKRWLATQCWPHQPGEGKVAAQRRARRRLCASAKTGWRCPGLFIHGGSSTQSIAKPWHAHTIRVISAMLPCVTLLLLARIRQRNAATISLTSRACTHT